MAVAVASPEAAIVRDESSTHVEAPSPMTLLVPVVWELITRYIGGSEIIAVCSTLSKPMWARFRLGVSGQFSIRPVVSLPSSPCLYSFLKYLPRLTSISLLNSHLTLWRSGPRIFELFPPTIRHVSLAIPLYFDLWLIIPREKPLPLANDAEIVTDTKRRRTAKRLPFQVLLPKFKIGELVPALESLCITSAPVESLKQHSSVPDLSTHTRMLTEAKQNFIKSLPPSLSRIELPFLGEHTPQILKVMSDSIQDTEICLQECPSGTILRFPNNIRRLGLKTGSVVGYPTVATLNLFSDIPDSLETLEWHHMLFAFDLSSLKPLARSHLQTLELTILSVNSYETRVFDALPPTLTSFTITALDILPERFSQLPRQLTTLSMCLLRPCHSHHAFYEFEGLPEGLKVLELRHSFHMKFKDFGLLPRGITRLVLALREYCWPSHICVSRECESNCAHARLAIGTYGEDLSGKVAKHLPPHLTSLKILNSYFDQEFLSGLPETLETLEFESRASLGEYAFSQLPAGLKTLNFSRSPIIDEKAMNWLPQGLTDLKMWNAEKFCSSSIEHLPRSLISLQLEGFTAFHDKDVKALPRGLLHLIVPKTESLTSESARDLPRGLVTFRITSMVLKEPRPTKMDLIMAFPTAVPAFDIHFTSSKRRRIYLEQLA